VRVVRAVEPRSLDGLSRCLLPPLAAGDIPVDECVLNAVCAEAFALPNLASFVLDVTVCYCGFFVRFLCFSFPFLLEFSS